MARRELRTLPLVVRTARVAAVADVTPRMRRITLAGPELHAFERDGVTHPAFESPGFDDHVKIVLASDGDVRAALPVQLPAGIEWPPSETRRARDYTPRRVAPGELDLDVVLHGDGPAAAWAGSVAVGDELSFVGPKSSTVLPDDLDWLVLVGDETALPAIGRYLDERPGPWPVRIAVVVSDPSAVQELALAPDDRIDWLVGDQTDGAILEAAVRRLHPGSGRGVVWCAGESRALLPVRRLLARELAVPKRDVNVTGYWHVEPADDDEAAGAERAPAAPPSPLAWLAVRAALQLGIVDAVADRPGEDAAAVADAAGADPGTLAALLPALAAAGVVRVDGDALRLGPHGDELLGDEHAREAYDGLEAERVLALADLATARGAGVSPWELRRGASLAAVAARDGAVADELAEAGGRLAFLLGGLVADPAFRDARTLAVAGPGAAAVIDAFAEAAPELAVVKADAAGAADAGVGVFALALGPRTDAEASALFEALPAGVTRLAVVEDTSADALGGGLDASALLALADTGSPRRDADRIAALARGWRLERVVALGWGTEAVWLAR